MRRDLDNEIRRAEVVLRAVAGDDLAGHAIYIVLDTIDKRLRGAGWCAFTWSILDLVLRPLLKARGEWHGTGFAMVLSVQAMERFPIGPARQRAVVGHVLHEYAHWVFYPRSAPLADVPAEVDTPSFAKELETFVRPYQAPAVARAPWFGHEHQFLRAAIHTAWTARERCDQQLVPEDLSIAGNMYGLSPCRRYEQALAGEFELGAHLPLRAILNLPGPPSFLNLFLRDVAGGAAPST